MPHAEDLDSYTHITTRTFEDSPGKNYTELVKIWITFAMNGIHCYPSAPDEVAYLRDPHRHLFKFKVSINVLHDDREIEFHMLQNEIKSWYDSGVLQLNHKSCEMLARELLEKLRTRFPNRHHYAVEVSEDGECGAEVSYEA